MNGGLGHDSALLMLYWTGDIAYKELTCLADLMDQVKMQDLFYLFSVLALGLDYMFRAFASNSLGQVILNQEDHVFSGTNALK